MIQGTGTISNYGAYISNCTKRQWPYKIPVRNLSDVQLFIDIGGQPDYAQYQLIHTCGPHAGTIETLTTSSYVIGQKPNDDWYGVFKNFDDTEFPLSCFVIGITLTFGVLDVIYFSEEYCIDDTCDNLTLIKACYGNLDNKISYGCDGVYFGRHATENTPLGDPTVYYQHQIYLRDVEVTLSAIKNTFKKGRTRNFRTEKEKIRQFWAELIPEWYIDTVDAIFYRGEVIVGDTTYLVEATNFEKLDECLKSWKPSATFNENCYQSFSCEENPCLPPEEESEGSGGNESSGGGEESGSGGGEETGGDIIVNKEIADDVVTITIIDDTLGITIATLTSPAGENPSIFNDVIPDTDHDYLINVSLAPSGRPTAPMSIEDSTGVLDSCGDCTFIAGLHSGLNNDAAPVIISIGI